jgi:manganese transport protein
VIFVGEEKIFDLLIFSQVVLSLQLGFAVIPLIRFVSNKKIMGNFVIPLWQKIISWIAVLIILFLNLKMVFNEITNYLIKSTHPLLYGMILFSIITCCIILLLYISITPLLHYRYKRNNIY